MSQGKLRKGHGADSRLAEAADRLREGVEVCAGEGGALPSVGAGAEYLKIEASVAETYAKENNLWIPLEETFRWRKLSGGNENEVFLSDNNRIYKINNLMNDGGILPLLERVLLHNRYFPETCYELVGFTGTEGRSVFPVFRQQYIRRGVEVDIPEIEAYMLKLGFSKTGDYSYTNGEVTVDDLRPRSVLKDDNGTFYIIDAGLKRNL